FLSRYFIHEILFVFFSLGVVVAILRFKETAHGRYLLLASLSAALLCATKETWIISIAVWLLAIPSTTAYLRLRKTQAVAKVSDPRREEKQSPPPGQNESAAGRAWTGFRLYAAATLLFAAVWVLFYSSFFTNFPAGVYDSVRTFSYWFKTGE